MEGALRFALVVPPATDVTVVTGAIPHEVVVMVPGTAVVTVLRKTEASQYYTDLPARGARYAPYTVVVDVLEGPHVVLVHV